MSADTRELARQMRAAGASSAEVREAVAKLRADEQEAKRAKRPAA
jgi:carbamoylphosphate synthase small subunit